MSIHMVVFVCTSALVPLPPRCGRTDERLARKCPSRTHATDMNAQALIACVSQQRPMRVNSYTGAAARQHQRMALIWACGHFPVLAHTHTHTHTQTHTHTHGRRRRCRRSSNSVWSAVLPFVTALGRSARRTATPVLPPLSSLSLPPPSKQYLTLNL